MEKEKVQKLWNRFETLLTVHGGNPFVVRGQAFDLFYKLYIGGSREPFNRKPGKGID